MQSPGLKVSADPSYLDVKRPPGPSPGATRGEATGCVTFLPVELRRLSEVNSVQGLSLCWVMAMLGWVRLSGVKS